MTDYHSRRPCPAIACQRNQDATIETVNGQDVVRCKLCGRAIYNAPRSETGRGDEPFPTEPRQASKRQMVLF